ncbi:hypothetical protein EYF80_068339 [Liparis tanakae]|uniref:Uncharacterized protein n=1 Tax=Liparis tanakae TaxID=230148 RepID=A0A4Z2DYP1_9TELE|nr:hypothetical protein EYF80_068339 [Liparis tanakae]
MKEAAELHTHMGSDVWLMGSPYCLLTSSPRRDVYVDPPSPRLRGTAHLQRGALAINTLSGFDAFR